MKNKLFIFLPLFFVFICIQSHAQCWKSLSMGTSFSAGIKQDGTLWTWGDNTFGQLGDGTYIGKSTPIQIGSITDWAKLSCGSTNVVALKNDGTLWAWGNNEIGQLGIGSLTSNSNIPIQVGQSSNWVNVAAGRWHVLALDANGNLWSWGFNANGALGNGTQVNSNVPLIVGLDTDWESIVEAGEHSLGIKGQNILMAWGRSAEGQLGTGTPNVFEYSPQEIGSDTWYQVNGGMYHTVSLKYAGPQQATLWTWGYNDAGQLGNGTNVIQTTPVQIGTSDDWTMLACNFNSTYAIKQNGSLWAWGGNEKGQLGDGSIADKLVPTQISNVAWQSVFNGKGLHMLATKPDGSLWTWGNNDKGQLGNGTTINSNTPLLIMPCLLGVEENTKYNITIFPNPASDWLQIKGIDVLLINELYITDLKGQQVAYANKNTDKVNIKHLDAGVYFVHLQGNQQSFHSKFIKQ